MNADFRSVAKQLSELIRSVEKRSCAELVIEIRARSGPYGDADARAGAALAFLALIFLLFAPFHFSLAAVVVDVLFVYFLGVVISMKSAVVRRLFTTGDRRKRAVRTMAGSLFFERGIANTSAETGIIVYMSLLERSIEVIADRGVLRALPAAEWNLLLSRVTASSNCSDPAAFIKALEDLGALLAKALPVGDGDVDELASEPVIDLS